jgi:DNA replication protein DnaC
VKLNEIEAAIAALGRPGMSLAGFRAIAMSLDAAKAWDAANPARAAEYRRLTELHDAETRRTDAEERERLSAERAMRTMGAKLSRSGVGERALAAAVEPDDSEALSVVKRWLPEHSLTWLGLCGAKGTGKSVAATWGVREAIRSGGSAAFRRASELAKLSQFDEGAKELERLKHVNLLVVDDFGTELLTDYARSQLHELFDHRHENYGRTIITSNLRWQGEGGMKERLGERLADRFAQAGRLVQLAPEPSMRRKRVAEVTP